MCEAKRAAGLIQAIVLALVLAIVAACSASTPSSATPDQSIPEGMPSGEPTSIDIGVEMSPDNRVATLRFIGGPILPATDPCRTEYAGWAKPSGDVLQVAVVLLPRPPVSGQTTPFACSAVGADREVQVMLDQPFTGTTAEDVLFGTTIPIERAQ